MTLLFVPWCVLLLALIHTNEAWEDQNCKCACECPPREPVCETTTPAPVCEPTCEFFLDTDSAFYQNCGIYLNPIFPSLFYKECSKLNSEGKAVFIESVQQFCLDLHFDSFDGFCESEPALEPEEPTDLRFSSARADCSCMCLCNEDPRPPCSTTTSTTTPTTPCVYNLCDGLCVIKSEYYENCGRHMSKKERKTVFEQCLLEDPANLDDYFYALGTYCATKCGGDYFTIPDPCVEDTGYY